MPTPVISSRPPWALTLVALIGAALSFNAIRVAATPYAGLMGGVATAILFDAAMWLASRWYIDTVRAGHPLRPALWLSLGLVAVTLTVNVAGARNLADGIVHGIGPGLFAAFTWIEATIELRAHRAAVGARERIPAGEKLVHPVRSVRVWLMMLAAGTASYTAAQAMRQNREARRRTWRAAHRPHWVAVLARLRPGWRSRVDPAAYVAYRWGSFTTTAHVIGTVPVSVPGVAGAMFPELPDHASATVSEPAPATFPTRVPCRHRHRQRGTPRPVPQHRRWRRATPARPFRERLPRAGVRGCRRGSTAGVTCVRNRSPS